MAKQHRPRVTLWTGGKVNYAVYGGKFRVNQPVEQKLSRPKGEKSRKFKAKYPGTCPACHGPWVEGDLIRRCGGFYYHDICVK